MTQPPRALMCVECGAASYLPERCHANCSGAQWRRRWLCEEGKRAGAAGGRCHCNVKSWRAPDWGPSRLSLGALTYRQIVVATIAEAHGCVRPLFVCGVCTTFGTAGTSCGLTARVVRTCWCKRVCCVRWRPCRQAAVPRPAREAQLGLPMVR